MIDGDNYSFGVGCLIVGVFLGIVWTLAVMWLFGGSLGR